MLIDLLLKRKPRLDYKQNKKREKSEVNYLLSNKDNRSQRKKNTFNYRRRRHLVFQKYRAAKHEANYPELGEKPSYESIQRTLKGHMRATQAIPISSDVENWTLSSHPLDPIYLPLHQINRLRKD